MDIKPAFISFKPKAVYFWLGLLIIFYLLNGVMYLRAQSATFDEGSFLHYAIKLLTGHPERTNPMLDNSKMPISVINLIPRAIQQLLHPDMEKRMTVAMIVSGRYITLLVSILIIVYVYKWSKDLYGWKAGLLSAFLISFCPNMIANAGLVTTDSYSMLFLLASIYYLWLFCNDLSNRHFLLLSVFIALSQLVKQSLFHLYIIFPLVIFIYHLALRKPVKWKSVVRYGMTFILINWIIINTGFYFRDTNTTIGSYHFMSKAFIALQHLVPRWIPVPFPKAFVTGLDMAKYYDQLGGGNWDLSSFGNVTILGKSSTYGSFWYYYFVSIFFKTPIASLILILAGFVLIIKYRPRRDFVKNEFFLLFPVLYYLVYMSFFYKTQCGIRHIIFIYPFLYIISGQLINYTRGKFGKTAVSVLCLLLVASVFRYWSNYYPYTNEFIWDKKLAYRFVGAGNLEFNQGEYFFQKYLKEHPEVHRVGKKPAPGIYLITANDYLDIWNLHEFDWIRSIRPSGQVAFNGLLITVRKEDINQLPLSVQQK